MKQYVWVTSLWMAILLAGCQIPAAMIATAAGSMPAHQMPPRPTYNTPPQKIYEIDEHRYFTLENYRMCGGSQIYYNDIKGKIRTFVNGAVSGFPGRLLLDGNPDVMVFPSSAVMHPYGCGDRGCHLEVYYSMDGGRTFDRFHPLLLGMDGKTSYEKAKTLTITLKGKQLYIAGEVIAAVFELHKGIRGGVKAVEGGPTAVPSIKPPSRQDHLVCNDSLRAKEVRE